MMIPCNVPIMALQTVVNLLGLLGVTRVAAVVQVMMPRGKTCAVATPTINFVSQLEDGVIHAQGLGKASRPSAGKVNARIEKKEHKN